jgi:hypothetical protein
MSNGSDNATKADLQELRIELIDRMQGIERRIDGLERRFDSLGRSILWQIIVPSLTLIVSLIIHYLFR